MKKRLVVLVGVFCLVSILVACVNTVPSSAPVPVPVPAPVPTSVSVPTPAPASTPAPAPERGFKWPSALTLSTPAVGGAIHTPTIAWTPVMEKMTGVKIRVMPGDIPSLRARWLAGGVTNFDVDTVSEHMGAGIETVDAYATRDGGPFQRRACWLAQMLGFGFIVRGNSAIKTVYDIKPGTRVGYYTAAPASIDFSDGLLAWAGVDKKDIVVVGNDTASGCYRLVTEGKADVTMISFTAAAAYEAASIPSGVRVLEMDWEKDPEGAKRMSEKFPAITFGTNKLGMPESIGVKTRVTPCYMFASEKTDTELVYNMVKWLDENYQAYKDKNEVCSACMDRRSMRESMDYSYAPFHEGLIKYMKELGLWTAKDDARQRYNVDLISKYEKAYKAAIAEADAKGINIDPTNKAWVQLWNSFKKDLPRVKYMMDVP